MDIKKIKYYVKESNYTFFFYLKFSIIKQRIIYISVILYIKDLNEFTFELRIEFRLY